SRLPLWSLPLLILATPLAAFIGVAMMTAVIKEPSAQLKALEAMARAPSGAFAVVTTLCISVIPAFVEETLFRGYVQRRLLERWNPAAAIGMSSLMFVSAHLDPAHMLAVVPLGIWLGVVAWRCGAVWPSMLCHSG